MASPGPRPPSARHMFISRSAVVSLFALRFGFAHCAQSRAVYNLNSKHNTAVNIKTSSSAVSFSCYFFFFVVSNPILEFFSLEYFRISLKTGDRFSFVTIMTEDTSLVESTKISYSTRIKFLNPIAKPLAPKGLTKKLYKLVKKGNHRIVLLILLGPYTFSKSLE